MLIVGYGNPLRGDDAVGLVAATRLWERGLDVLTVHQLTPELAERVAAAETVIFLDADATLEPGEISIRHLEATAETVNHHATPAGLLYLARTVYGAQPTGWAIGIGVESFALGEGLSAAAERAVERAVEATVVVVNGGAVGGNN